ncbi:MAG: single-stranded DNA-binding protein [candidate division Zixibacteria bacterium]|nr:single-stranded DNA-binding protein [candidate division Zixibacteria bacterium]
MANYNRVFLLGNLTADPESRDLPTGGIVTDLRLAVNRRYRNRDGELAEEVSFVDCTAYGRTAEVARDYLRKGRPAFLEGRLQQDRWETGGGEKRSKLKVVVERLVLLPRRADATAAEVEPETTPPDEPSASEF